MSFVVARLKSEWHLTPDRVANLSSAGLAGMFFGGAVAGSLADRFGRKTVFQTTLLIFSAATGLCALAQGFWSLLGLRFLVSLGLGGELPVAAALVSELAPAQHRGRLVVLLESFWAFGWAAAAIIAEILARRAETSGQGFPWRIAFFIGALPALYLIVLRRALPESPRYLSSRGRLDQAETIIRSIEAESGVAAEPALQPDCDSVPTARRAGLRDLFARDLARRTVMLWLLWFTMAYSYYGIFTWLPTLLAGQGFPLATSFRFTLIITLAQIPGYFTAAWLVEKTGRKATLIPFMLLCALGSFFFGGASSGRDLILWGCLLSFFNLGAWGVTYGYTPELYPTWLRGTGTGSPPPSVASAAFWRRLPSAG